MASECKGVAPETHFLIIHGTDDATIPYVDSSKYELALPNTKLIVLEGADHGFKNDAEHGKRLIEEAVAFLKTK